MASTSGQHNRTVIRNPRASGQARITLGLINSRHRAVHGSRAYVPDQQDFIISVVDTATNTVVTTIPISGGAGVAVTPDGTRAYVTSPGDGTVSVIDTATNTMVATIFLGTNQNPSGVAITPDGSRAYVTINLPNIVSVIDTTTNTVVTTIPVGLSPTGVAITPDGTRAYVTNNDSNTVSVIDTATNTVTATLVVGIGPNAIAISPGIGPPTKKDQCKDDGWRIFTIPRKIKKKGNCVSFVNIGGH